MKDNPSQKLVRRKRIFAAFSIAVILALIAFLTYFLAVRFMKIASSDVEFRYFIQGYGAFGIFVAVGLQVVQVFIALIPGEVVEIGLGFAYGWFGGTLVCLIGVAIGSSLIFLLVKKFGMRLVEIFVSLDKINELKLINNEQKLRRLTFILYFIPGTPKDLITYFIGLTRMTLSEFLTITIFARIPTVVSSTVGGNLIGSGQYIKAVILFVITAVVSLAGMKLYDVIMKKIKRKYENRIHVLSSTLKNLREKNSDDK